LRLDHGALLHLDEIVLGEQKKALVHGTEIDLDIASTLKACDTSKETMEFSLSVLATSCITFAGIEARLDCGQDGLSMALKSAKASFVQSFIGHVELDSIVVNFSDDADLTGEQVEAAEKFLQNIILNLHLDENSHDNEDSFHEVAHDHEEYFSHTSRSLHSTSGSTRVLHEDRFYYPSSIPDNVDHPDVARTLVSKTFVEEGRVVFRHTLETVALAGVNDVESKEHTNFGAATVVQLSFGTVHPLHNVQHSLESTKRLHQATLDHHEERRLKIADIEERRLARNLGDGPEFKKEVLKLEKCDGSNQHCFTTTVSILADYAVATDGKFHVTGGGTSDVEVKVFGAKAKVANMQATITFDQDNNKENRKPKVEFEFTSPLAAILTHPSDELKLPDVPTKFEYDNTEDPEDMKCDVNEPAWEHVKCPQQLGDACDKTKTIFYFKKTFLPGGLPVEAEIKAFGEMKPGVHAQMCTDDAPNPKERAQAFGTLQNALKGYASVGVGNGAVASAGVKVDIQFASGQVQISADWITDKISEAAFAPTCSGIRAGLSGPGISIQLYTKGMFWDVKHTLKEPKLEPSKLVSRYNKECNTHGGPVDDSIDDSCCPVCPPAGDLDTGNDGFSLDSNGCPEVNLASFKSFVAECPFGTTSISGQGTCDGSCYDYLRDSLHCGLNCVQCDPEPAPLSQFTALAKSFCMDGKCIEKPLDHCCTGSACGFLTDDWEAGQMRILPSNVDPNIDLWNGLIQYTSDVDMKTHYESGGTFRAYISFDAPGIIGGISASKFRFGRHCKINGREVTNSFCENPLALSETDCNKLGSTWRSVFTTTTDDRELRNDAAFNEKFVVSFPYYVHPNDLPFTKGQVKFDCIISDEVSNYQNQMEGMATINGGLKVRAYLSDEDTSFLDCLSSSSEDCSLQASMMAALDTVAAATALTPWSDSKLCPTASDEVSGNYDSCGVSNGDGSTCEPGDPPKVACADVQPTIVDTCIPKPAGYNCCNADPTPDEEIHEEVDAGGGPAATSKITAGAVFVALAIAAIQLI
jgi:hypothetical protein